ncbi:unnamed protein product [Protopolystoma xenopodis]|uniref:Uncharacterized protein n=1 Tax=Protopolystoma xenopodis TaxID=117903 RepID=A0A448XAT6_9PLAT|nr:unnamed protein product [Protopolystoma xenopodis]
MYGLHVFVSTASTRFKCLLDSFPASFRRRPQFTASVGRYHNNKTSAVGVDASCLLDACASGPRETEPVLASTAHNSSSVSQSLPLSFPFFVFLIWSSFLSIIAPTQTPPTTSHTRRYHILLAWALRPAYSGLQRLTIGDTHTHTYADGDLLTLSMSPGQEASLRLPKFLARHFKTVVGSPQPATITTPRPQPTILSYLLCSSTSSRPGYPLLKSVKTTKKAAHVQVFVPCVHLITTHREPLPSQPPLWQPEWPTRLAAASLRPVGLSPDESLTCLTRIKLHRMEQLHEKTPKHTRSSVDRVDWATSTSPACPNSSGIAATINSRVGPWTLYLPPQQL